MAKVEKEYKHWEAEKRLIPTMVRIYCKGNHKAKRKEEGIRGKDVCSDCKGLTEFAEYRLEKCPFKKNKGFCSFCKIHCYKSKPEYREEMQKVMKYAGPRMLFSHPVFSISHVVQLVQYKKKLKKEQKASEAAEQIKPVKSPEEQKDVR